MNTTRAAATVADWTDLSSRLPILGFRTLHHPAGWYRAVSREDPNVYFDAPTYRDLVLTAAVQRWRKILRGGTPYAAHGVSWVLT